MGIRSWLSYLLPYLLVYIGLLVVLVIHFLFFYYLVHIVVYHIHWSTLLRMTQDTGEHLHFFSVACYIYDYSTTANTLATFNP